MTRKQLIEYLENILTIEVAIQQERKATNLLDGQIRRLGQSMNFEKPAHEIVKEVPFHSSFSWLKDGEHFFPLMVILSIPSVLFSFILFFKSKNVDGSNPWEVAQATFEAIGQILVLGKTFICIMITLFALVLVFLCICDAFRLAKNKKINADKNEAEMKDYNEHYEEYKKLLAFDDQRVLNEKRVRGELEADQQKLFDDINTLEERLQQMYDLNILHYDFRGLVPVSYLYKYITAGITDRLDGPTGAYSFYLQDERANKIIDKLDIISKQLTEISRQLGQIAQNQQRQIGLLYGIQTHLDAMESSLNQLNMNATNIQGKIAELSQEQAGANNNLSHIASSLQDIGKNLDTTATNSHVIAFNDYRRCIEQGVDTYLMKYPA